MQAYVPIDVLNELDTWYQKKGKTRSDYVSEALQNLHKKLSVLKGSK